MRLFKGSSAGILRSRGVKSGWATSVGLGKVTHMAYGARVMVTMMLESFSINIMFP